MFLVTSNCEIKSCFPEAGDDWEGTALFLDGNYIEFGWSAGHSWRLADPQTRIIGLIKLYNNLKMLREDTYWCWRARGEAEQEVLDFYFGRPKKPSKGFSHGESPRARHKRGRKG